MSIDLSTRLFDAINRSLAVFGEPPLPSDAGEDEVGLVRAIESVASRLESSRLTPAAKTAMANRLRSKPAARLQSDAAIEARLRAKGVDPKFMPKFA